MNATFWFLFGLGILVFLWYVGNGIYVYLVLKAETEKKKSLSEAGKE